MSLHPTDSPTDSLTDSPTASLEDDAWTGAWVREHAGVELLTRSGSEPLEELCGLALRRNPKRFHLVVSTVLAKHVPVPPSVARRAGAALGTLVADALAEQGGGTEPVALVLGYAETATGLGHLVADRLGATALHSTRRPGWSALSFEEEHSHATTHRVQPHARDLLARPGALVLVDDELTTGRTILNTVRALHAIAPRRRYVAAALVDLRPDAARATAEAVAAELGVEITFVSLRQGEVAYAREPEDVFHEAVAAGDPRSQPGPGGAHGVDPTEPTEATETWTTTPWPAGAPDGGRHGLGPAGQPDRTAFEQGVAALAAETAGHLAFLPEDARVHVLGTEELMYLPLRLAEVLERTGLQVTTSSTTRSPVVVLDEPGYAVRHGFTVAPHDGADDGKPRFAYNIAPGAFDAVVLVVDAATPEPGPQGSGGAAELRAELRRLCDRLVVVRVAPDAPDQTQPDQETR